MISFWFSLVMILVVTGLALAVMFTDILDDRLYGSKRIFFVVLLLAYAVYRAYRLYQVKKLNDGNV